MLGRHGNVRVQAVLRCLTQLQPRAANSAGGLPRSRAAVVSEAFGLPPYGSRWNEAARTKGRGGWDSRWVVVILGTALFTFVVKRAGFSMFSPSSVSRRSRARSGLVERRTWRLGFLDLKRESRLLNSMSADLPKRIYG